MNPDQPHNIAIAEFEHNGQIARVTGKAATENDDAIQFIVDLMAREGITGDRILRVFSERKPSATWYEYFAQHWPNALVTWSFGPGEDARMEAAVTKLLQNPRRSWWKLPRPKIPHWPIWFVGMVLSALFAHSHGWTSLSLVPLIGLALIGAAVASFQLMTWVIRRKLVRMTPQQRAQFLARFPEHQKRRLLDGFGIHE